MDKIKLTAIVQAMKEREDASDTELVHIEADELLLQALKTIAYNHAWLAPEINELIEAYEKIDKWYA
jgi:hypothetical protein